MVYHHRRRVEVEKWGCRMIESPSVGPHRLFVRRRLSDIACDAAVAGKPWLVLVRGPSGDCCGCIVQETRRTPAEQQEPVRLWQRLLLNAADDAVSSAPTRRRLRAVGQRWERPAGRHRGACGRESRGIGDRLRMGVPCECGAGCGGVLARGGEASREVSPLLSLQLSRTPLRTIPGCRIWPGHQAPST